MEHCAGPRVFAIGLNKTGTSSIRESLAILGIHPIPSAQAAERARILQAARRGDYEPALAFAASYRGFDDRPWNMGDLHRRLHERYPDSRFVLTVRDEESWWRSVERWVTVVKPGIRDLYLEHLGAAELAREPMLAGYRRYNEAVVRYFQAAAPDQLLVMDLAAGDGWEELCAFLREPVPDLPFRHANRQSYRDVSASRPVGGRCYECDAPLRPARERGRRRREHGRLTRLRRRLAGRAVGRGLARLQRGLGAARERWDLHAASLRARARSVPAARAPDDLAAVCCFFDVSASGPRLAQYEGFRDGVLRAGVPLLTVELAFEDRPHRITTGTEDVLRLRSRSVLWHKERLLNLGIEELLRRGYRKIAWLDADIHFLEDDWPARVAGALEQASLVQVFDRVSVEQGPLGPPTPGVGSVRFALEHARHDLPGARRGRLRRKGVPRDHPGYGWAARAELLEQVRLYEGAVVGGGDALLYLASLPRDDRQQRSVERFFTTSVPRCDACGYQAVSLRFVDDYHEWAQRWGKAVDGRLGYARATIRDSFHGSRARRKTRSRQELLLRQSFDPAADLTPNVDAVFEWASEKLELHEDVRRYLQGREGYS